MTSVTETALGDVESELATTRQFLELIPDDKLDWKPHAKSNALGRLAMHIIELVKLQGLILTRRERIRHYWRRPAARRNAGWSRVAPTRWRPSTKAPPASEPPLAAATDASLSVPWTLRLGDRIMGTGTRAAVLRRNGISHLVHHRAQLGLYYRLLDIPVPGTYGPTADTK